MILDHSAFGNILFIGGLLVGRAMGQSILYVICSFLGYIKVSLDKFGETLYTEDLMECSSIVILEAILKVRF